MMITASREDFVTALTRAAQGLPARPLNPVHAGMLITAGYDGHVRLTCGDDQMMFTSFPDCHDDVLPGSTVLPGKMLAEMTRYFPASKDIRLEVTGTVATITAGRSVFTLPAVDPDEYPVLSQELPALAWAADQGEFARELRRVLPAAARNDPVLSCVLMVPEGALTLVCTDRYGMGVTAVPVAPVTGDNLPAVLIPAAVAERLAKVLDGDGEVMLGWDDRLVVLDAPGLSVITRQVQGRYPKWRDILAGMPVTLPVSVPVPELVRAVSMAAVAAAPATSITLDFDHADLTITAGGTGNVTEYLETAYDGDPVTIIISSRMLLDGLSACGQDAKLAFTGPHKPVFITGNGTRWMVQPYRSLGEG